jgi:NAD(P)H-hydrate repair Nnr-like enzyme with NAD(P)H-hydrate dehydratase domain
MDTHSYWQTQQAGKPLFPDIEWSKPERRDQAGKLAIIGGNKLGFAGVAESYSQTLEAGVGVVKVLLPDVLKKTIPATMTDVIFAASNPSGSLAKDALVEMKTLGGWADGILLVGDAGRNSETAIVYEDFIREYAGMLTITRDAVDLVKNSSQALVERPDTLLVVSFAQLQKLFQTVYYPKILTFSMQLSQLVEALHKFTITYPCSIVVLHKDHIIVASGGDIVSQPWDNAMAIWRGSVAAKAASYWLWNRTELLKSVASSLNTGVI